jgi:hypothetical protein
MFTKFAESIAPEVELPHDDPTSISLILIIAHLKFYDLPVTLSMDELYQLAMTCDKYDTVAVVRLFLQSWVQLYQALTIYHKHGNEKCMSIAYVFGHETEFCGLANHLGRTIFTNAEGRYITKSSAMLDGDFPPELVDTYP